MPNYVSKFKCTICGTEYDFEDNPRICLKCNGVLNIEYDLEELNQSLKRSHLKGRLPGVWKYFELLPLSNRNNIISLGEGGTFLHKCERLGENLGLNNVFIKDETSNPTGAFIDRGTTVEISKVRETGINSVYCATTGNMAASLVAYAARAGLNCRVILPRRIDIGKFYQIVAYGTEIEFVKNQEEALLKGLASQQSGHFVMPNNPFFLEGIKTTGYEIPEQLEWQLPDYIIVPMGNGCHISMIWKAINELYNMGFLRDKRVKLIGTQESSCAPIVRMLKTDKQKIRSVKKILPIATDIAVQKPSCSHTAIKAIKESSGTAVDVSEKEILEAVRILAKLVGIFAEPASATTIAALKKLLEDGQIDRSNRIVCIITGMGLKYPEVTRDLAKGDKKIEKMLNKIERRKYTTKLGETKKLILQILSKDESFGYGICKILDDEFNIKIKIPSVYQHLNELTKSGLIIRSRSEQVFGKPERNYYKLTERGKIILKQLRKLNI
jgi:threonine synthase